jgi:membrane protein
LIDTLTADVQRGFEWRSASNSERLRRIGQTVYQAGRDLVIDNGFQWAAALAYYSLLSLFPLLLATVSIAAFFVEPEWAANQITRLLGEFLPEGEEQIEEIVTGAMEMRGQATILSILTLLWSGTRVFGALTIALNLAYDVDDHYPFYKRHLIELVMTLTIGAVFVLALASNYFFDVLWDALQFLPADPGPIFSAIRFLIPAVLLFGAYFLIYRFVPRCDQSWKAAATGALVATLMFGAARPLFFGYVQEFGEYNVIYGSLAIGVILVFWAWIVALITLFGGELASHVQAMIVLGRSAQEVERHHEERSSTNRDRARQAERPRAAPSATPNQ